MSLTLQRVLLVAAVVAFSLPPPAIAADNANQTISLRHNLVPGERFVYESDVSLTSAHLRRKEHFRYTFEVDRNDAGKGALRIEHSGYPDSGTPVPITIRPDGSWSRADGRTVASLVGYDPAFMCKHDTPVRPGESWDCRIDGAAQYRGAAMADPGDVHVKVARINPDSSLVLQASYRSQSHTETVMDEDTHQDIQIVKQSARSYDLVLQNGIVSSVIVRSKLGTRAPGITTAIDVNSVTKLIEHK